MIRNLLWSRVLLMLGLLTVSGGTGLTVAWVSAAQAMHTSYAGATLLGVYESGVSGAAAVVGEMGHLMVYISVSGLKPGTTHAEQIYSGLCGGNGPVRFPLNPLVADASGRASSLSTVMTGKVQAMGWSINVHDIDAGLTPISCGNIWGPDLSFALQPSGKGPVHGAAIILGNMDTRGGMAMRDMGVVVVTLAQGLPADTMHAEHLRKGMCGSNGAIVFPLNSLMADARGNAVAATFLPAMARVMAGGLSLNVHAADSGILACGNDSGRKMHSSM